jgi:sulfite reductase (ferredoxin)
MLTGLTSLIAELECEVRLTPQQNILLCGISDKRRSMVRKHLHRYGIRLPSDLPNLIVDAMACPALPTCGLALAESERVFPSLLRQLNAELARLGLDDEHITVRMTGCPNGCSRPYTAEIAFVGKTAGVYDIHAGGDFTGTRLAQVLQENVAFEDLVSALVPLLSSYRDERFEGERLGAFCARTCNGHYRRTVVGAAT